MSPGAQGRARESRRAGFVLRTILLALAGLLLWRAGLWLYRDFRASAISQIYQDAEGLRSAFTWAPDDPAILQGLASIYMYDPVDLDQGKSQELLETALRRSPYDISLWLDYSRVLESQGLNAEAEQAARIGVTLAPKYFQPSWILANIHLRSGQLSAAYASLAELGSRNPDAVENILELVWQSSGQRPESILDFAGTMAPGPARSSVVAYLARRRELAASITAWNRLLSSSPERQAVGWDLLDDLLGQRAWKYATVMNRQFASGAPLLWNGDFEQPLTRKALDWRVESSAEVRVWPDDREAHSGTTSLALEFPGDTRVHFAGILHYLPVEPEAHYRLSFYHKSAALTAGSGLVVKLQDPTVKGGWWMSRPILPGPDWTAQELSFDTGPSMHWLLLSIEREPAKILVDYVSGRVWLDDFVLTQNAPNT